MTFNTDKLANGGLVLLIAYAAFSSVIRAASKSFWCDEVITVGLARLPALGTIRDALEHAADSHPPPFYALERTAAHLPGNELITFRIPSILAYCCMVLCIFLFIKKRRGSACALVCAAIPMASLLFSTYAVEARGYSLSDRTPEMLEAAAKQDSRLVVVALSRNFGHQTALAAALDHVTGDGAC